MSFSSTYLIEASQIIEKLDTQGIEKMVGLLCDLRRQNGRLFIVGVGGGAGHATHAVGDFRKIAGIEAYAPTDNIAELTARTNDEGWDTTFVEWLKVSHLSRNDCVFVFSVGGGDLKKNISPNLVRALKHAKTVRAKIVGIVGRNGGYTASVADACVIIPIVNYRTVTAHTESFQALVWHLMVSHPDLQRAPMKWESTE
ncbi:MAG: SIS domain-containing protein [Desulfobacterales bacterium]|jgi:D-sedoheptulose 7-phosphate isomerase|nr:SIS domain-containing protein [Desulfobacterales bacterium]MDP6808188.1 SIS domain-containing protein [Desulfobacterales bacterium]|tara:strand:+ start:39457 stop:40053 length:597 start_codon:yes stop_codon:yes gene_type:complete